MCMVLFMGYDCSYNDFTTSQLFLWLTQIYLTVLVGLYEEPEKPNDALDFIKQHMGADGPESADVESLKLEVTELRQKCEELTEENAELKARVSGNFFL